MLKYWYYFSSVDKNNLIVKLLQHDIWKMLQWPLMSETLMQYFLPTKLISTQEALGICSPSISVQFLSAKMERGFCAVQILVSCGMTNKQLRCIGSGHHHCYWYTPDVLGWLLYPQVWIGPSPNGLLLSFIFFPLTQGPVLPEKNFKIHESNIMVLMNL